MLRARIVHDVLQWIIKEAFKKDKLIAKEERNQCVRDTLDHLEQLSSSDNTALTRQMMIDVTRKILALNEK